MDAPLSRLTGQTSFRSTSTSVICSRGGNPGHDHPRPIHTIHFQNMDLLLDVILVCLIWCRHECMTGCPRGQGRTDPCPSYIACGPRTKSCAINWRRRGRAPSLRQRNQHRPRPPGVPWWINFPKRPGGSRSPFPRCQDHGPRYRVACTPDEQDALLSKAVEMVDGRMRDIAQQTRNTIAERVAVMAALNIATNICRRPGPRSRFPHQKIRLPVPRQSVESIPWEHSDSVLGPQKPTRSLAARALLSAPTAERPPAVFVWPYSLDQC